MRYAAWSMFVTVTVALGGLLTAVAGETGGKQAKLKTADYYVSPTGDDRHPGTKQKPFLTVQRAVDVVKPGQLIYLRGGTYHPKTETVFKKEGDKKHFFHLRSYPGEIPVIDGRKTGTKATSTWAFRGAKYWKLLGPIHLTNGRGRGVDIEDNSQYLNFERIGSSYNGREATRGAHGFMIYGKSIKNILFKNCDAHHNANHRTKPGENVLANQYQHGDGWRIFSGVNVKLIGCRAWNNLDDGYDFTQAKEAVEMIDCWAAYSAFDDAKGSITGTPNKPMPKWEGDGIKLGYPNDTGKHRLTRCISWGNHCHGYNVQGGPYVIKNSVSYDNVAASFFGRDRKPSKMHNNLEFADKRGSGGRKTPKAKHYTVSAKDFVSLNDAGMLGPRGADGSLPSTDFLKLVPGSDLIDAGVDVGLPFQGKAPDIGAREYVKPKE